MDYLFVILLTIFIYNYIFPVLSSLSELVNALITNKISVVQQKTIHIQEDIENTYNQINKISNDPGAIGFYVEDEEEIYE